MGGPRDATREAEGERVTPDSTVCVCVCVCRVTRRLRCRCCPSPAALATDCLGSGLALGFFFAVASWSSCRLVSSGRVMS